MDNNKQIQQIGDVIAECEAVSDMQKTTGWGLIKKSLSDITNVTLSKLIYCVDPAETVRLQEKYKAFNTVLDAVSDYSKLLEVCRQELQNCKDHKEYQDSYGFN